MPQNLIDTPAEWQDVIVVPAPGDQAAMANDATKPHSLFHALAALAKRTRWLRGLLETHNHDNRYAPLTHHHDDRYALLGHLHDDRYALLGHHHDDRYYTKAEVDTRAAARAVTGQPPLGMQVTVPTSGSYLIEGHATWEMHGRVRFTREFWIDGSRVWSDQRYIAFETTYSEIFAGSWADQIIYNLTTGTHSVEYRVLTTVEVGVLRFMGIGMLKVTRLG